MGYERNTTPFIDELAEDGLQFENAVAPGTYTGESMIYSMTGDHSYIVPDGAGIEMSREPWQRAMKRRETLAEALSTQGYTTIGFSPNPLTSRFYGFEKGFDHFEDYLDDTKSEKTSPVVFLKELITKTGFHKPWESFYDDVLETVVNVKEPYFLWVFLLDTHTPHNPPERRWSSPVDLWRTRTENLLDFDLAPRLDHRINLYDDAIRYGDKCVGRLWEDLEEDDPVFVVHSDHGEAFGEHGFYGHTGHFYREFVDIPLVIANAGQEGVVDKAVTPNMKELVLSIVDGTDVQEGLSKIAITKLFEQDGNRMAVRIGDWKLVSEPDQHLFNLVDDPNETEDVSNEYPVVVEELNRIVQQNRCTDRERELISKTIREQLIEDFESNVVGGSEGALSRSDHNIH